MYTEKVLVPLLQLGSKKKVLHFDNNGWQASLVSLVSSFLHEWISCCHFSLISFLIVLRNVPPNFASTERNVFAEHHCVSPISLLCFWVITMIKNRKILETNCCLCDRHLRGTPLSERHPRPKQQTNLCWSLKHHRVYSCSSVGPEFSKERWKPDCFTHTCSRTSLGYTPVSQGAQLIADLAHLQWQHTKVQFQEPNTHTNTHTHTLSRVYTFSHTNRCTDTEVHT